MSFYDVFDSWIRYGADEDDSLNLDIKTYFICGELDIIKVIAHAHDALGKDMIYRKGKHVDKIKENKISDLVRKYAPLIGIDNMLVCIAAIKIKKSKPALNDLEKQFKECYNLL